MDDRRQLVLRIAERREQPLDAAERQIDQLRVQPAEPLENPVARRRGHSAALRSGRASICGSDRSRRLRVAQQPENAPQCRVQFGARHDLVDHAVLEQILGALKPVRQLFVDRLLDDPRAGKADDRAGLGERDVADHREGRRDAAGRRIGQHDDVGQPRLLDHVGGDDRARHLHQRQHALLHARAARGRNDDQRRLLQDGELGGGEHGFAGGHAHRSAHERELESGDDRRHAADPPVRDDDRVAAGAERRLPFLQPVGVAFAVAESQRIDDRPRQFDPGKAAVVEQHLEAPLGADAQMMAAIAADVKIGFELAIKQHLLAARAFVPEIVRHRLPGDDRPDLRQDEIGQPAHRRLVAGAPLPCRAGLIISPY